jgi:ribonucleotide monophosphatase NagD (HAD superfamily)
MICANPDVVVERGDRLIYCAGALADAYAALGGEVYYAGKPHRPLYDLRSGETATARAARSLKGDVPLSRVLAIGDSVRTDLKGAHDLGVDCLFVTAGIHAEELGHRDDPDIALLGEMFAKAGSRAEGGDAKAGLVRRVMPRSGNRLSERSRANESCAQS